MTPRAALAGARAYVFDMDGTLVDNLAYHVQAWHVFSRRQGHELTDEQIVGWTGAPDAVYMERMLGRPVPPDELRRLEDEKESLYRALYAPHLAPAPGLGALLARARRAGVVCAVASGAPTANVDFVLDGLGLRGAFAAVVDASQYERGKPAPDCFLLAAARLGVAPADCVVFEDARAGVQAAHAAGMRAVALTTSSPRAVFEALGAECIVSSFTELLERADGDAAG